MSFPENPSSGEILRGNGCEYDPRLKTLTYTKNPDFCSLPLGINKADIKNVIINTSEDTNAYKLGDIISRNNFLNFSQLTSIEIRKLPAGVRFDCGIISNTNITTFIAPKNTIIHPQELPMSVSGRDSYISTAEASTALNSLKETITPELDIGSVAAQMVREIQGLKNSSEATKKSRCAEIMNQIYTEHGNHLDKFTNVFRAINTLLKPTPILGKELYLENHVGNINVEFFDVQLPENSIGSIQVDQAMVRNLRIYETSYLDGLASNGSISPNTAIRIGSEQMPSGPLANENFHIFHDDALFLVYPLESRKRLKPFLIRLKPEILAKEIQPIIQPEGEGFKIIVGDQDITLMPNKGHEPPYSITPSQNDININNYQPGITYTPHVFPEIQEFSSTIGTREENRAVYFVVDKTGKKLFGLKKHNRWIDRSCISGFKYRNGKIELLVNRISHLRINSEYLANEIDHIQIPYDIQSNKVGKPIPYNVQNEEVTANDLELHIPDESK